MKTIISSNRLILFLTVLISALLLLALPQNKVSAASCSTSVFATSTVGIEDPGSYTIWVRYQSQENTNITVSAVDSCFTMAMPKTPQNEWTWTSVSTQGINTVALFSEKKSYTIDVSGNELIKLDSLFLLKLGEVCRDSTSIPKANADNCKTALVQTPTTPDSQPPSAHNEQHTPNTSTPPKEIPPILGNEPVTGRQELPAVTQNTAIPEEVKATAVQVEYYVDKVLVAVARPDEKPSLDTNRLENGKNDVEIVVTDGYGNKTRYSSSINVSNNKLPLEIIGSFIRSNKKIITMVTSLIVLGSLIYLVYRGLTWHRKREMQLLNRGITREYRSEFSTIPYAAYSTRFTGVLLVGGLFVLSTGTLFASINSTPKTIHVMVEFENAILSTLGKSEAGDTTAIGNSYIKYVRPLETIAQSPQPNRPVVTPPTNVSPAPQTPTPLPRQTTTRTNATSTTAGQVPKIASNFNINSFLVSESRPASSASEPTGNFRFICEFSHFAYDDPIVYPNNPGISHLHMFFGNTTTSASSTYESLRQNGDSTCQGGPINRSAYWVPAVYNSQTKLVIPDYITVYYKGTFGGVAGIQSIPSLPQGLRMIAGYNMANPSGSSTFDWYCEITQIKQKTTQNCPNNERLGAVLPFQQCWDGQNLDSADHRSHMAYLYYGADGMARCPSSHPVHLAEFTIGVWFPNDGNTSGYYLSSDRMSNDTQMPNGSSWHADWYGAWDDGIVDRWTTNCIRGLLSCSGGNLGDGQALTGARNYTGPIFVDPPAKP